MMSRTAGVGLALSLVVACSPEPTGHLAVHAARLATELVIDVSEVRQRITGFGASSAWTSPAISEDLADQFFSAEAGIGLSLLRLRIAPNGTSAEITTARRAHSRNVKIWAAPWSPPGAWKSSGTDEHGGKLLLEHYQDWADRLVNFVEDTKAEGVDLFAISAQNEPDWVAEWETCEWTPEELAAFIGDYLGPTLAARGFSDVKVIGPESANWNSLPSYANAILEHETARDVVDVIATHSYGGTAFSYTEPAEHDKEFWETEVSGSGPLDFGISSALLLAQMIHTHLTVAEVNAWHFWWMQPNGLDATSNDTLMSGGEMSKRGYVLGNFARFVRPGAVRLEIAQDTGTSLLVSAYKNPNGPVALVAINLTLTPEPLQLRFKHLEDEITTVTPWITDETRDLANEAPIPVTEGRASYTVPGMSVVTLVSNPVADLEPEPVGAGGANNGEGGEGGTGGESGQDGDNGQGGSNPTTGGSAGSPAARGGNGTGANSSNTDAGAPSDDECCIQDLPRTPNVACLCSTPGSARSTHQPLYWLSAATLLGLAARRKKRRL